MSFGGNKTTSSTKVMYTPEQQAVMSAAMPNITNYVQSGGAKMPEWSKIPGFNASQLWGQDSIMGNAQGSLKNLGNLWGQQANFIAGDALNADSNPYLRSAAEGAVRPVYDNLLQKVMPNIRGEMVTNGMYGSTSQGIIENQAINDANQLAADTTSKMYAGAYDSGMSRLMQSLGMGETIGKSINVAGSTAQGAGDQAYALEAAQKEEAFQKHMYEQLAPFLASREGIAAMLQGGVSTQTTAKTKTNPLMQALGGITAAASLFA